MGLLYVLFGEVSVQVFCPFLNWVVFLELSCISSLYILEIKLVSDVLMTKMISHTVASLFVLLMVSLAAQKLFNLM